MSSHEKELLQETYLNCRTKLRRYLLARFRDEEAADDILQMVFLKIQSAALPDRIDNHEAYLVRLTSNAASDFMAKLARDRGREKRWGEENVVFLGEEPVDRAAAPDEALSERQKLRALAEAIKSLPPQSRKVFLAHKLKGQPHTKIAAELNISKSAVEKNIARAMRLLKEHFANEESD